MGVFFICSYLDFWPDEVTVIFVERLHGDRDRLGLFLFQYCLLAHVHPSPNTLCWLGAMCPHYVWEISAASRRVLNHGVTSRILEFDNSVISTYPSYNSVVAFVRLYV